MFSVQDHGTKPKKKKKLKRLSSKRRRIMILLYNRNILDQLITGKIERILQEEHLRTALCSRSIGSHLVWPLEFCSPFWTFLHFYPQRVLPAFQVRRYFTPESRGDYHGRFNFPPYF